MKAPSPTPVTVATPGTLTAAAVPVRRFTPATLGKAFSTVLIGVFFALIAFAGAGTTQPAQALFCFGAVEGPLTTSRGDFNTALFGGTAPFEGSLANRSVTVYEEYGVTGATWSEYRPEDADETADGQPGCFTDNIQGAIGNGLARDALGFTATVTNFTLGLYEWAADPTLLNDISEPLDCMMNGCGGANSKGLKDTLFLAYLTPIIVLGAIWAAWTGLVKKRTTETVQGALWMVGAAAFALIFMASPSFIAKQANATVGEISSTIINGVTNASSATVGSNDMCYLPNGARDRGIRTSTCSLYKAMLVTPWAAGQFGVPMSTPLRGQEAVIGNRTVADLRVAQIDAQTIGQTEAASGKSFDDLAEADGERWMAVKDSVWDERSKADKMMWAGEVNGARLNIAISSVVASLALGGLIMTLSFASVVLSAAMIMLLMLAPVFLLVGVHPGFGRGIALKWLELLLGTVFKRIALAAVLSILLALYQVILESNMAWFAQIALSMAVGIGAIVFRKPLMDSLNVVRIPGASQTGIEGGSRAGEKAGVIAAGAGAGALAGLVTGGGMGAVVGGAVRGGTMGSRSGSAVRAATMGTGAGRRVASQKQGETRESLQAALKANPNDEKLQKKVDAWNRRHPRYTVRPPEDEKTKGKIDADGTPVNPLDTPPFPVPPTGGGGQPPPRPNGSPRPDGPSGNPGGPSGGQPTGPGPAPVTGGGQAESPRPAAGPFEPPFPAPTAAPAGGAAAPGPRPTASQAPTPAPRPGAEPSLPTAPPAPATPTAPATPAPQAGTLPTAPGGTGQSRTSGNGASPRPRR